VRRDEGPGDRAGRAGARVALAGAVAPRGRVGGRAIAGDLPGAAAAKERDGVPRLRTGEMMAEPHGAGERGGREPRERTMAGGEQREYYVDKLRGLLASAQTELGRVRTERDEARVGRDAAETELARRRAGSADRRRRGPSSSGGGGGGGGARHGRVVIVRHREGGMGTQDRRRRIGAGHVDGAAR
jgi:hypothetical protein